MSRQHKFYFSGFIACLLIAIIFIKSYEVEPLSETFDETEISISSTEITSFEAAPITEVITPATEADPSLILIEPETAVHEVVEDAEAEVVEVKPENEMTEWQLSEIKLHMASKPDIIGAVPRGDKYRAAIIAATFDRGDEAYDLWSYAGEGRLKLMVKNWKTKYGQDSEVTNIHCSDLFCYVGIKGNFSKFKLFDFFRDTVFACYFMEVGFIQPEYRGLYLYRFSYRGYLSTPEETIMKIVSDNERGQVYEYAEEERCIPHAEPG